MKLKALSLGAALPLTRRAGASPPTGLAKSRRAAGEPELIRKAKAEEEGEAKK